MPLVLNSPKTAEIKDSTGNIVETANLNAIKIVSTPSDNDLNTTVAYIEEGTYDPVTKTFTAFRRLPEIILAETQYASVMQDAKAIYDATFTADPLGVYKSQKIASYNYLASALGLNSTDYTII